MLNPAAWAALGVVIGCVFTIPLVPLLLERGGTAALAASTFLTAGIAIFALALALGAQSTQALPEMADTGEVLLVVGPYGMAGGFAAALLFALGTLVAQLGRR